MRELERGMGGRGGGEAGGEGRGSRQYVSVRERK